jgi:hypothetical protein
MKKILLLFVNILIINYLAMAQAEYVGLKLGYLGRAWKEIGIGYGYVPAGQGGTYIPGLILSPTLGVEFNHSLKGEERSIIAPKFSFEAHYVLFGARLNVIDYQTQGQHDWRFRPEAGLSLLGIVNVFYGYNIPLSENRFAEVQPHKISLALNLPLKKL